VYVVHQEVAMNLSFLGPFHPQIVHTPIVMLIFSALFALVGNSPTRAIQNATVMLVFQLSRRVSL
jgi:uncharacterized membrane protein